MVVVGHQVAAGEAVAGQHACEQRVAVEDRGGVAGEAPAAHLEATVIVQKASASGRPLREVALEEGVDAKLYDRTIDLRRIARGNRA